MEEQRTGRRNEYKHCEGAGKGEGKLNAQAKMGKKGERGVGFGREQAEGSSEAVAELTACKAFAQSKVEL